MPRGRRKRVIGATLPPRGFYKARVSLLLAYRRGIIGRSAFILGHIIDMFSWDRALCDLTNEALAHWLGVATTETVRQALVELKSASLIEELYDESNRRFLKPIDPPMSAMPDSLEQSVLPLAAKVELDSSGPSAPPPAASVELDSLEQSMLPPAASVELDSSQQPAFPTTADDKPAGITPKYNLGQIEFAPNSALIKEEVIDINQDALLPPEGGMGGICPQDQLGANSSRGNSQQANQLAALLTAQGVYENKARELARHLLATMSFQDAHILVRAHILDLRREHTGPRSFPKLLLWRCHNVLPTAWARKQARSTAGSRLPEEPASRRNIAQAKRITAPVSPPELDAPPPPHEDEADDELACLWKRALEELRHQMTRATFDTWLCNSRLVSADDSACVIAVNSGYARDWLEARLKPVVARTLAAVLGHEVEVQFVVTEEALQGSGPV